MSSYTFGSGIPRNQDYQNHSFWNPNSPLSTQASLPNRPNRPNRPNQASLNLDSEAHHQLARRRQSEYLSRTMANALGTVHLPNFNYDDRKPHRITSPLSDVKPIGFERNISHQLGHSNLSISAVGEDAPSVEEESRGNSPIITKSLVRGFHPVKYGASSCLEEDEISILDLKTSVAGLNFNDSTSPSKVKKSYGTLQEYFPYAQAREHTESPCMQFSNVAKEHRDITAIFRGPLMQSSLPLNCSIPHASQHYGQSLGHRAVGYEHNAGRANHGGFGQYMAQFSSQLDHSSSNIDGDYSIDSRQLSNSFLHQQRNEVPHIPRNLFGNSHLGAYSAQYTSNATFTSISSTVNQAPNKRSDASFQAGLRPTDQLLREQGLLAPLPADSLAISNYIGSHDDREFPDTIGGELNLPNGLNCAVWILGIPKNFARNILYQELFKVVSIGPIIAASISLGGDQHSHHAAKVVFKHPEHAARLYQRAYFQGIYINGDRLRIEPNRHGHREYPKRLHYRSRVVLVEVFRNPGMDLAFWKMFVTNLCVYDIESCRHLAHSTPERMIMEFRFARIFGQASVLLAGIRNTASFEGTVTARYIPDVACDICEMY